MKQFKLAVSLFVSASLFSSATFAYTSLKDDVMPVSANTPYDWTGFYIGLNAGMVKNTMNVTDNQATSFYATIQQASNPKFTGGFQFGYRRQLELNNVTGVYGVEFSADFSNAQFNKEYGSNFAFYDLNSENKLQNVILLQAIGGIAANRTLLFLAAGLSWTNINGSLTSANGAPFFNTVNVGNNMLGTAFGGGIEYAFSNALSARFKVDVITPNVYSANDGLGDTFEVANNIIQTTFGLNYKFG